MDEPKKYAIRDLTLPGLEVWLTVGLKEVIGYLHLTPAGRSVYRVGTIKRSVDLPKFTKPTSWRPKDERRWPCPLPEPIISQKPVDWGVDGKIAKESPEGPEPTVGWPYPGLRLGRAGEIPKSVKECEARILRALRAEAVYGRERPRRSAYWPKDLMIASKLIEKGLYSASTGRSGALRDADYADFHIDKTDLRPLPARWEPTPRDVSDYEWHPGGPLSWPTRAGLDVLVPRAALPAFAFWQIAQELRTSEDDAKRLYQHECEEAFRRAQNVRAYQPT